MPPESGMNAATAGVPVVFEVGQDVVDRLLGAEGKKVLRKVIDHAQQVVREERWPARNIHASYYRDYEDEDWETLIVAPLLIKSELKARFGLNDGAALNRYIDRMAALVTTLPQAEREIRRRKIGYGIRTQ